MTATVAAVPRTMLRAGAGRAGWGMLALASVVLSPLAASRLGAQLVVPGGNFEICDYCGTLQGKTAFLVGRPGFGTTQGVFVLVNPNSAAQDVNHKGYTPGVDFLHLYYLTTDFVNVRDPARVIRGTNFVLQKPLSPLFNGTENAVTFLVNIPPGTPAGEYRGRVTVQDSLLPPNNPDPTRFQDAFRVDYFNVDIQVLPQNAFSIVQGDTAATATGLTLRGRPGQTVNGVLRIANLGNVALTNTTIQATDLVATSGTGLVIRRENITFSPSAVANVAFGDTARLVVTVRIPTGILAGTYTGELIFQPQGTAAQRIPLTVIVTTPGDIVFETNPVRAQAGDQAVIIFNADPGTQYEIAIFDMMGMTTFRVRGTVFGGSTSGGVSFAPDQAVRFTWNLANGLGEQVAGGMYYVVVDVLQSGTRRLLRDKLLVIR